MLERIETEPGSLVEVEAVGESAEGGEWRIKPTPSLLAEPSRPSARTGLVGACSGQGRATRLTILDDSNEEEDDKERFRFQTPLSFPLHHGFSARHC